MSCELICHFFYTGSIYRGVSISSTYPGQYISGLVGWFVRNTFRFPLCRRLWTVTERPCTTERHVISKSNDQQLSDLWFCEDSKNQGSTSDSRLSSPSPLHSPLPSPLVSDQVCHHQHCQHHRLAFATNAFIIIMLFIY